jgi:hypothetical protein
MPSCAAAEQQRIQSRRTRRRLLRIWSLRGNELCIRLVFSPCCVGRTADTASIGGPFSLVRRAKPCVRFVGFIFTQLLAGDIMSVTARHRRPAWSVRFCVHFGETVRFSRRKSGAGHARAAPRRPLGVGHARAVPACMPSAGCAGKPALRWVRSAATRRRRVHSARVTPYFESLS